MFINKMSSNNNDDKNNTNKENIPTTTIKELIDDISSLIDCGISENAIVMIDIERKCLYIDGWTITLPIRNTK
jgi:hypothetical protein